MTTAQYSAAALPIVAASILTALVVVVVHTPQRGALGIVFANVDNDYYKYLLGGGHCCADAPGNPNACLPAANATAQGCLYCAGRVAACHWDMAAPHAVFGHTVTPMFLINDIFMAFFFGLAA